MILETIEVEVPTERAMRTGAGWPTKWVVPAAWGAWAYGEGQRRISRDHVPWWAVLRISRIEPNMHYWPIRLTTNRGRVLFTSKAWKEVTNDTRN